MVLFLRGLPGRRAAAARFGPWLAIAVVSLLLPACDQPTGPAFEDEPGTETRTIAEPIGVVRLTTGPLPAVTPVTEGDAGPISVSTGPALWDFLESTPGPHRISTAPVPISSMISAGRSQQSGRDGIEATVSTPGTDLSVMTAGGTIGVQSVGSADIVVTKTSSATQAKVGENFVYTLTVRNNGPDAATTVTMNDVLPASIAFVGFVGLTGPSGAACVFTSGTVQCNVVALQPGEQAVLTMTVKGTAPGVVTNTATGGSAVTDPVSGNNSASVAVEILPLEADIVVTKTSSASQVKVGENFAYTLTVRNNGPDAAPTVTMNDVLPASIAFVSFISLTGPGGAVCIFNSGAVQCNVVALQPGEQAVLTMTVKGTEPGLVTNTAEGGSAVTDPVPGNNSASVAVEILALEADIVVTKTSSASQVKVGENFVYTLTVRNNGPDAATTVTMEDVLPASIAFVSFVGLTGPGGAVCIFTSGTVQCNIVALQPGEQAVLTMTVKGTAPGVVTNTAEGGSAVTDPVSGNNSASVDVEVLPLEADIAVTKTSSASQVKVGENFVYTLTVRNNGPDAATTVTMEDVLPASIAFVSFVGLTGPSGVVCIFSSGTVTCHAATLQSGEQFVLTLTVTAVAHGLVTNTATGGSAVDDPVPGNNSASVETLLLADGCGPGFWKNWPSAWSATGHAPDQTVGPLFANSGRGGLTLMQALGLMGGNGPQGAKDILLRAAVAALLNAAHPDVVYPLTAADVLARVNTALASGHRGTMLALAGLLDGYNNLGCPIP